jgi:hypothetical protein
MMAAMVARGGDGVLKLAQQTHTSVLSKHFLNVHYLFLCTA